LKHSAKRVVPILAAAGILIGALAAYMKLNGINLGGLDFTPSGRSDLTPDFGFPNLSLTTTAPSQPKSTATLTRTSTSSPTPTPTETEPFAWAQEAHGIVIAQQTLGADVFAVFPNGKRVNLTADIPDYKHRPVVSPDGKWMLVGVTALGSTRVDGTVAGSSRVDLWWMTTDGMSKELLMTGTPDTYRNVVFLPEFAVTNCPVGNDADGICLIYPGAADATVQQTGRTGHRLSPAPDSAFLIWQGPSLNCVYGSATGTWSPRLIACLPMTFSGFGLSWFAWAEDSLSFDVFVIEAKMGPQPDRKAILYNVGIDGRISRLLDVVGIAQNSALVPSPDGSQLAFLVEAVEPLQLAVVGFDGTGLRLYDTGVVRRGDDHYYGTIQWLPDENRVRIRLRRETIVIDLEDGAVQREDGAP
jgi:hypothetical protein